MRFTYFRVDRNWKTIAASAIQGVLQHNCMGLAAEMAFYYLLALFPTLLFLVALIGYVPVENAMDDLISMLRPVAPSDILQLVREQIDAIAEDSSVGLLTAGALGALWSSSAAMVAIIEALNRVYNVREWRLWWKRRILAILLTMALALFVFLAMILLLIGPEWAARIAALARLTPVIVVVWQIVRLPAMIFFVVFAVDLIFHFAPNRTSEWTWITPGALVSTSVWLLSSWGLQLYLSKVTDYVAAYGTIGGIIVTMLWFYVCNLAVLIGAEINGAIETPAGEPPGAASR